MSHTVVVYADETNPDILFAWYERTGDTTALRDFTGYTGACEIIDPSTNTIAVTKSTGVTLGDGSAASNVGLAFTAVELAALDDPAQPVTWLLRITATNGSERAVFATDESGTLPRLTVKPAPT